MCLISVLRLVVISQYISSMDATWDFAFITNWNFIEVNSAILVPCLIVLKPLMRKLFPKLFAYPDPDQGQLALGTSASDIISPAQVKVKSGGGTGDRSEKGFMGSDTTAIDVESRASSSPQTSNV